jgi:hypothetical protein
MISHTRAGLAATLAVASLAASAAAVQADPNPAQRLQSSERAAALAQERYYMSHKPAIPAPGHDFGTIDVHDAAPVTAPADRSSDFEWGDAAIGAGSALGLALVFAGGAVAVTRRHGGTTGGAATS